jgi:16S rRNA (adenine1518-N6/adenine1519-N6)-dimethyltransferase
MEILPTYLILMFQKEFAERLITKKLNSLNSLVNCFYEINSSFNVSKNCFRPIPKIDSTVLFFKRKKKHSIKKKLK